MTTASIELILQHLVVVAIAFTSGGDERASAAARHRGRTALAGRSLRPRRGCGRGSGPSSRSRRPPPPIGADRGASVRTRRTSVCAQPFCTTYPRSFSCPVPAAGVTSPSAAACRPAVTLSNVVTKSPIRSINGRAVLLLREAENRLGSPARARRRSCPGTGAASRSALPAARTPGRLPAASPSGAYASVRWIGSG